MGKSVIITGITGQDGSYMADLLLKMGYQVHGIVRRLSRPNVENIQGILNQITLHEGDLHDQSSLNSIVRKVKPDELYNLASQSFVGASWNQYVQDGTAQNIRPAEVMLLCGDSSKAKRVFGWEPRITFERLVELMVQHEIQTLEKK